MPQFALFDILDYLFLFTAGVAIVLLLKRLISILRRGGIRGAMFNARVGESVGEVHGADAGTKTRVTVYVIERDSAERVVGVEPVSKSLNTGASRGRFSLSSSETRQLITTLEQAFARL